MRNYRVCRFVWVEAASLAMAGVAVLSGCGTETTSKQQNQQLTTGYAALNAGQTDTAISDADTFLQKTPSGAGAAEALYLKGRAFESRPKSNAQQYKQDYEDARNNYQLALEQDPVRKTEAYIRASLSNVTFFQDDFRTSQQQASAAYDLLQNDPDVSSVLLYRIGVCQQRLGEFSDADRTFDKVQMRYPKSPLADRARQREGLRAFYVQLATFESADGASKAAQTLNGSGLSLTQHADASGHTLLDAGPYENYDQARAARARFVGEFPHALIVP